MQPLRHLLEARRVRLQREPLQLQVQLPSGHLVQREPLWRESSRSAEALLDRTRGLSSLYDLKGPSPAAFSCRPEDGLLAPGADSGDRSVLTR